MSKSHAPHLKRPPSQQLGLQQQQNLHQCRRIFEDSAQLSHHWKKVAAALSQPPTSAVKARPQQSSAKFEGGKSTRVMVFLKKIALFYTTERVYHFNDVDARTTAQPPCPPWCQLLGHG
uniref:Uncharacterized protein n=1 Tax=Heterosigma akashiwo TaxID=2829 RepID=A0A7S3Y3C8_HETAK